MQPSTAFTLAVVYAALAAGATIDRAIVGRQETSNPSFQNEVYLPLPGNMGTPPPDMATISQIKEHCDASSDAKACMEAANACAKRLLTNRRERRIPVHRIQSCADTNQKKKLEVEEDLPLSDTVASTDASARASFKADLRVDTNRDGVVDVEGSSDEQGKNNWTNASGAIFLANIGDSNGRCKKTAPFKNNLTKMEELIKCHDADDDEQRAPQFLAPMRTMPLPGLSKDATGSLVITAEPAQSQVRIFQSKGDKWEIIKNDTVLSAEDLKKGLTLGVDSRSTRVPGGWDGRVSIDFNVKDGDNNTSKDTVMLRVAPVLIHHHKQAIDKMFAFSSPLKGTAAKSVNKTLDSIETSMPLERLRSLERWAQDIVEPGYMSMPGPDGKPISMRILIEGKRPFSDAQRLIYTQLRDTGIGAADPILRTPDYKETGIQKTLQAGGNTEAIPPYEFGDKKFPAGRVILGGEPADLPRQLEFYRAQEAQDPIILDSMWLYIKHVDEMIQFVPSKTPQGFAVVAVDPELGLKMLREAAEDKHGSTPIINKAKHRNSPTIDKFLASKKNEAAAAEVGRRMAANIELIKKETGIADDAIFRMPMLVGVKDDVDAVVAYSINHWEEFSERRRNQPGSEALEQELTSRIGIDGDDEYNNVVVAADNGQGGAVDPRKRAAAVIYESYLPSLVNGVPLSDAHYMAPKPFGPEINGTDIFEAAAKDLYQKVGFSRVDFHDAWLFHKITGDLHCMTNTFRDTSDKWW